MFKKILLVEKVRPSATRPFFYRVYVRQGWPFFRETVTYIRTLEDHPDREYPKPHWFQGLNMVSDPLLVAWLEYAIEERRF